MARVRCQRCGHVYSDGEGHRCPAEGGRPFDPQQWRRDYMRKYMREWRRRVKALKLKDAAE